MERARLNVADGADERRRGLENTGMAQDFLVQQLNGFKENNRIFMIFVCWMLDPPRFFAPWGLSFNAFHRSPWLWLRGQKSSAAQALMEKVEQQFCGDSDQTKKLAAQIPGLKMT